MTKYIMTSARFTGTVTFGYDDEFGLLEYFDVQADMSEQQRGYIASHLPLHKTHLTDFLKKSQGSVDEVPADISFDAFWEAFGHKVNKARCLPLYKKLTADDKLLAIVRVLPYKRYCNRISRKTVDPERFLKDRFFDTDWRALK